MLAGWAEPLAFGDDPSHRSKAGGVPSNVTRVTEEDPFRLSLKKKYVLELDK